MACRSSGGGRWQRVVREERLELSWIAPLDPKSSAYANFATLAQNAHCKATNLTQLCAVGKSGTACLYWKSSVFCVLVAILLHEGREFGRIRGGFLAEGEAPMFTFACLFFTYAA